MHFGLFWAALQLTGATLAPEDELIAQGFPALRSGITVKYVETVRRNEDKTVVRDELSYWEASYKARVSAGSMTQAEATRDWAAFKKRIVEPFNPGAQPRSYRYVTDGKAVCLQKDSTSISEVSLYDGAKTFLLAFHRLVICPGLNYEGFNGFPSPFSKIGPISGISGKPTLLKGEGLVVSVPAIQPFSLAPKDGGPWYSPLEAVFEKTKVGAPVLVAAGFPDGQGAQQWKWAFRGYQRVGDNLVPKAITFTTLQNMTIFGLAHKGEKLSSRPWRTICDFRLVECQAKFDPDELHIEHYLEDGDQVIDNTGDKQRSFIYRKRPASP